MSKKRVAVLISTVALLVGVLLIPVIYSGFYLAAMWDPYGRTGDMPVAVVNEDKGAVVDGKEENVGDQLVNKLKDNHDLKWEFVDRKTAEEGLTTKDKYYAIVWIPPNFSEDIASADTTEKTPATIFYTSNEKRNYLASIVMETAMESVKSEVRSSVTEQITGSLIQQLDNVPGQLHTLDDGLTKLSTGSTQLSNGMTQLESGSGELESNLGTLNQGLTETKDGVDQLNQGVAQVPKLINGVDALHAGASAVADGSTTLEKGIQTAGSGAKELNTGAGQLKAGIASVSDGVTKLEDGTQQVEDGIAKLQSTGLQTLSAGTTELSTATAKLAEGTKALETQLPAVETALTEEATLANAVKTLADGLTTSTSDSVDTASLEQDTNTLKTDLSTLQNAVTALKNNLASATPPDGMVLVDNAKLQELKTAIDSGDATAIQSAMNAVTTTAPTPMPSTSAVTAALEKVEADQTALQKDVTTLQNARVTTTVAGDVEKLKESAAELSALVDGVGEKLTPVKTAVTELNAGADAVAAGAAALKAGIGTAKDTSDKTLYGATNQLKAGVQTLEAGLAEVQKGIGKSSDKSSTTLYGGVNQLQSGTNSLVTGFTKQGGLIDGAKELASGSQQVASGTKTLQQSTGQLTELQNGVGQLTSAISQLQSGGVALHTGAQTLHSGISSAVSGAKELESGTQQAQTGVADSITKANEGLTKTKGLSDFSGNSVNIVAEPYEAVPNYGSGFAPFFMNVSLWAGGLTMLIAVFYDHKKRIEKLATESDKPLIRMFSFYGLGIGQSLLVATVVHLGLGLQINNIPLFYLGLALCSITYVSVILFLLIHLGDVGEILGIVLLVLQLTSSGGMYPVEMTPAFFRVIHPFLPMTYGIDLMRQTISGYPTWAMARDFIVLGGFFVGFTILVLLLDYIKIRYDKHKGKDVDSRTIPI